MAQFPKEQSTSGEFERQEDAFREWISADDSADYVYYIHFKCSLRRILDYPNLQGYLMDLYQQPGIAETFDFDHIKRHYYMTHERINPSRIVPIGPVLDLMKPHGREKLSSAAFARKRTSEVRSA